VILKTAIGSANVALRPPFLKAAVATIQYPKGAGKLGDLIMINIMYYYYYYYHSPSSHHIMVIISILSSPFSCKLL